jgi:hypothetical protein
MIRLLHLIALRRSIAARVSLLSGGNAAHA